MSLTSGERQALSWLLAVMVVGAGARVVHRRGDAGSASAESAESLRRQLVAVDSAQRTSHRATGRTRAAPTRRSRRRAVPDSAQPPPTVHVPVNLPTLAPVDLDQADSAALERLPRIGPSLAARIVAERVRRGPFGSVEGLQRVRGIGPKLAAHLAPLVTFSGTSRPSVVQR